MSKVIKIGFRLKGVKKSYQLSKPDIYRLRENDIVPGDPLISKLGYEKIDLGNQRYYKKSRSSKRAIIWLHPGGYCLGPLKQDFTLLNKISKKTKCDALLLDYPKAPEFQYQDTFAFVEEVLSKECPQYDEYFLIGASAGGGLALGLTYKLKIDNKKLPSKVFTFSPWIDLALSIDSESYEASDPFLSKTGLKFFAENYAPDSAVTLPYVSPFYANFEDLDLDIYLYSGTHEILHPTAVEFFRKNKDHPRLNLRVFEKMIHCWPMMPMREARKVHKEIIKAIC